MTAGKNNISPRIAVNETGLVPSSGHLFHKVEADLRSIRQVIRCQGEVLDRILEQHCRCQLKDVRGAANSSTIVAAVQTLVQEHTAKLHASHSIADERVQRGIEGLVITEMLAKYQILGSQHRLAAYVIGIHPFPAARQGTAVEDNHQTVVVGIAQNLLVQTQGLLLVTAEEVYFDTLHTQTLQPAHLLLAGNGVIHPVDGTLLYIVPVTTGAIPQEYLHTLATGILDKLFHAVATDVVVPPVVNQYIFVSHGGRQVNIAHLVVVVDAAVLPENPAPCATARLVIMGGGIAWFHYIPGDGGFHNRLQGFPHRHSTPRRGARQGKGR